VYHVKKNTDQWE